MSSQEFTFEQGAERHEAHRVVELEIRMPKLDEIKMPKVDMEPVRQTAEQVLLTTIGAGVLLARALVHAVQAANAAGAEAAKNPGPVTRTVLNVVRGEPHHTAETRDLRHVPVLPIADYDDLSVTEVLSHLPELSAEQLRAVRSYEEAHQRRTPVLAAIDRQMSPEA